MDIVSVAAIAVIVYIALMFLVRMTMIAVYVYFVMKFFTEETSTPSVSSDQFNPNLDY